MESNHTAPTSVGPSSVRYLNVVLTVIAGLLGVMVLDRAGPEAGSVLGPAHASAQSRVSSISGPEEVLDGRISAAEQRKQMIAELKSMSQRLDRIESSLSKGIRVTEMPEMKLPKSLEARLTEGK